VVQVLECADEPMRMVDVKAAVEEILGEPVAKSSVMNCLAASRTGGRLRFERVGRGLYRLASKPDSASPFVRDKLRAQA
jgi:hypothetical protein